MNMKKIMIVYLDNYSLKNTVAKENVFQRLIVELENEGKMLNKITMLDGEKRAMFDDGTMVFTFPVSRAGKTRGMRVTHLYIDESIKNIENGQVFINEAFLPCLVHLNHIRDEYEIEGNPLDRVHYYSPNNL